MKIGQDFLEIQHLLFFQDQATDEAEVLHRGRALLRDGPHLDCGDCQVNTFRGTIQTILFQFSLVDILMFLSGDKGSCKLFF